MYFSLSEMISYILWSLAIQGRKRIVHNILQNCYCLYKVFTSDSTDTIGGSLSVNIVVCPFLFHIENV